MQPLLLTLTMSVGDDLSDTNDEVPPKSIGLVYLCGKFCFTRMQHTKVVYTSVKTFSLKCFTVYSNTYKPTDFCAEFYISCTGYLAIDSDSYILSCMY